MDYGMEIRLIISRASVRTMSRDVRLKNPSLTFTHSLATLRRILHSDRPRYYVWNTEWNEEGMKGEEKRALSVQAHGGKQSRE
ncbi:hypothetical protein PRIPAC_92824, partial [Pristionchus pacificus]|uniref:Uncharacterized protein n=1 Tax=Pristionchus pacificus TaxID=54126 RepID=A0A2A6BIQ2_PRIPA